jgi:hypothetical protein
MKWDIDFNQRPLGGFFDAALEIVIFGEGAHGLSL